MTFLWFFVKVLNIDFGLFVEMVNLFLAISHIYFTSGMLWSIGHKDGLFIANHARRRKLSKSQLLAMVYFMVFKRALIFTSI